MVACAFLKRIGHIAKCKPNLFCLICEKPSLGSAKPGQKISESCIMKLHKLNIVLLLVALVFGTIRMFFI